MWERVFTTTVELPIESLWSAASEIASWPAWDSDIEGVWAQTPACLGTIFVVKDASGRQVRSMVEECAAPRQFAYATPLFLGLLRTRFEFEIVESGTRVMITVGVSGLLGPLWRRTLRETSVKRLRDRAARLVERARDLAQKAPISFHRDAKRSAPAPRSA